MARFTFVILVKMLGMGHLTDEETEQRREVTCRSHKPRGGRVSLYLDHPKGLPGPEPPLLSVSRCLVLPAAWTGLGPLLTHLPGCDLEQLQTQPWVWPLALWPGCKVQGEQDLSASCCLKGPQALPMDGNQVQWQNEGQSPGRLTAV